MSLLFLAMVSMVTGKLDIQFSNGYNSYSILINDNIWLNSHDTKFRNYGNWAMLKLNGTKSQNGIDIFGNYTELTLSYIDTNHPTYAFHTLFKQYSNLIIFTQYYPNGAEQTYTNDINSVVSAFPSFKVMNATSNNLGFINWAGGQSGSKATQYGQWTDDLSKSKSLQGGIENSGVLVLYNEMLTECIVISPLKYAMASNNKVIIDQDKNEKYVEWGIQGNVTKVDAGFQMSYVMSFTNDGINKCMTNWGDEILKYSNKTRGNAHKRDFTLNYLGYSTDHGAYYWYYQEPTKTAQQTMIDVKKYHDSMNIPTKYLLLDSWWYQQSGPKGTDYNFTANTTLFPNGQHIYQQTGWFIQSQNRAWSYDAVYCSTKQFECTFNQNEWLSAPVETDKFWNYLFENNNNWGLIVYEQDHLSQFSVQLQLFVNNTEFGRQYMLSMARNAQKYNMTNQYCMSFPRHILQSAELEAVTQARVTSDYHPGQMNWDIGHSSLLTSALDVMPSKDSYWSMNTPQTSGNKGQCNEKQPCIEPYNRLNSAILSLSNGPYTFADRIGYTDYNVIMKCCMNRSGLLLRPSVAVTPIDKYFAYLSGFKSFNNGVNGYVYSTVSVINSNSNIGDIYYYYIFAAELKDNFNISINDINYNYMQLNVSDYLVYETNTSDTFVKFGESTMMELSKCGKYDFQLYTVIPINYYAYDNIGWYLQGELNKWITVSSQRFTSIDIDYVNKQLKVSINGDENERVMVAFVNDNKQQKIVQCTISSSGKMVITMPDAACN